MTQKVAPTKPATIETIVIVLIYLDTIRPSVVEAILRQLPPVLTTALRPQQNMKKGGDRVAILIR